MKYSLHPIPLLQTILLREFKKGKHLSSQESSEWSRKMYQLSLKLDMRDADNSRQPHDSNSSVSGEGGDENPIRFSRPTLSKAKSLLGGSWVSSRRLSESSPSPETPPLAIDTSPPLAKPPLAPSRGSTQMTIQTHPNSPPNELPLSRKQSSIQNQSNFPSNPTLSRTNASQISYQPSLVPSRGSQMSTLSPSEPLVQSQFSVQSLGDLPISGSPQPLISAPETVTGIGIGAGAGAGEVKKKKGFKKFLNVMKFKKQNSDSTIASNQSQSMPPPLQQSQEQQNKNTNIGILAPKESRKMIL
jgi:hypothetical protein